MQFKLKNKNNITLHTKNKRCREDISIGIDEIEREKIIPENIAEGQSILGVTGTFRGGIDTSEGTITADKVLKDEIGYAKEEKIIGTIETYDYSHSEGVKPDFDMFIMGELTEYYNDRVTVVSANIFEKNTIITSVNMPNLITTKASSFGDCTNLIKINFPKLETIGTTCFEQCTNLTEAEFPSVKNLGSSCFNACGITYLYFPSMTTLNGRALNGSNVRTIHIPNVQSIADYGFYHAHVLTKIIIEQTDSVAKLGSVSTTFRYAYHFTGEVNETYNPDGLQDGYIYVPDILLEQYKTATNWSTFADRFKPLSEYVEEVE